MQILPSFHDWFLAHRGELDAVVFDVDGVLAAGGQKLPGSLEFLRELRALGVPFALLTNDGNHSVEEKAAFLNRHGFELTTAEIVSCSDGLAEVAEARGLLGKLFFIVGDLGKPCFAEKAGLRGTRELERLPECAGVIVGEEHYDWEKVVNGVINYFIRHPGAPLLVPNPDEYYPTKGGDIHVAAGGIARFIQRVLGVYGVTVEPVYMGKPYGPIFEHNHHLLERRAGRTVARKRVVMLGDSIASDIRGANDFGYRSALLLTGVTREMHLPSAAAPPELVFRGF